MGGWGGGGDGVGTGHDLISSVKGDSAPRDATFKPSSARTAGWHEIPNGGGVSCACSGRTLPGAWTSGALDSFTYLWLGSLGIRQQIRMADP